MKLLDFLVIGLYGFGMLAVGRYYKNRMTTADEYLLGGRQMSPFMIGLSLFATLTSTLSYLAYPGEMIQNGPMIFAQLASYPVIMAFAPPSAPKPTRPIDGRTDLPTSPAVCN